MKYDTFSFWSPSLGPTSTILTFLASWLTGYKMRSEATIISKIVLIFNGFGIVLIMSLTWTRNKQAREFQKLFVLFFSTLLENFLKVVRIICWVFFRDFSWTINTRTCEKKSPRCQGSLTLFQAPHQILGKARKKKNLTIFPPILLFRVRAFSIRRPRTF